MRKLAIKLKTLNSALPGLILGILIIGVLAELSLVWFMPSPLKYTIGLWIGIGTAIFMAIHMAVVIADAVDFTTEKQAKAKTIGHAILRYAVVAAIFGIMAATDIGYILAALLGVISLKLSAYLQSLLQKLLRKKNGVLSSYDGAANKEQEAALPASKEQGM